LDIERMIFYKYNLKFDSDLSVYMRFIGELKVASEKVIKRMVSYL